MKKSLVVFSCFLLLSPLFVSGQDIHFSMYNLIPVVINPAQVGAYKNFQAILNYKSQWTSISPNAYKTMLFQCETRINKRKWKTKWMSAGLNLFTDKAGDGNMKTTQINGYYGGHMELSPKSTLGAGFTAGFVQRSLSFDNFKWDSQYINGSYNSMAQSNEPIGTSRYGYVDPGAGIVYQYNKGQMYSTANDQIIVRTGYSVFHWGLPRYSYYHNSDEKLYTKHIGHVDALIGIKNSNFSVVPGVLYMRQGPASEILPGCYIRYKLKEQAKYTGFVKGSSISVGTSLRVKDAFVTSIQYERDTYTIGLSYDINVSTLKTATSGKGGFEISIRYATPNPFLFKSVASFQNN